MVRLDTRSRAIPMIRCAVFHATEGGSSTTRRTADTRISPYALRQLRDSADRERINTKLSDDYGVDAVLHVLRVLRVLGVLGVLRGIGFRKRGRESRAATYWRTRPLVWTPTEAP